MSIFTDKTLMITGGTGSFGHAVLDRFLDTDIGEIRIFSRDEKKQDDMRRQYNNPRIKYYLGDVRDIRSIEDAVNGVDFIFSAAALKQVPSCEFFPMEAVKTNVIGTENLLTAAIRANVKKVICLSTDKAAYPINAMGISKAMMERVFVAKSRTTDRTLICGTRYGNVMCSRGSVIPLFIDHIKAGKPITVTDPDMTRFLMALRKRWILCCLPLNTPSREISWCRRLRPALSERWPRRCGNSLAIPMRSTISASVTGRNARRRCLQRRSVCTLRILGIFTACRQTIEI